MVVIRVLDHVDHAYTNSDGDQIRHCIESKLQENDKISLSFEGINSVSSSFLNSALIDLLENYDMSTIKKRITFVQSTKPINEAIKRRFSLENNTTQSTARV